MDENNLQQVTETEGVSEDSEQDQTTLRRRLGRGLNALLGGDDERVAYRDAGGLTDGETGITGAAPDSNEIHVELIEANPFQPRKEFAEEQLQELSDSIKQHGILQPILVRPNGNQYQLIAGERRLMAAKKCGLDSVPCRVLELDDRHVYEAAIEENVKRKDLGVLEKSAAFQDYLKRFECTIEELSKRLSMSRSTVNNYLRLLELPEAVKKALNQEKISNGHARALLSLPEEEQVKLCKRIQSESLSVRKTEEAVREIVKADSEPATIPFPGSETPPKESVEPSAHIVSLQDQLQGQLGSKVEIKQKDKESGKIVITFNSNDEFERIVRFLNRAA